MIEFQSDTFIAEGEFLIFTISKSISPKVKFDDTMRMRENPAFNFYT